MQIAAAALWQIRQGMRSKCRPSGHPQYAVRFARALAQSQLVNLTSTSDLRIYELLQDLEYSMVEQWAMAGENSGPPAFRHNGEHTTNKVLAGFAKVGMFLVPPSCIDGVAAADENCNSDNGADAVIDIEDGDFEDDLDANDVIHREEDFLEHEGPAPKLLVWTGPRYQFRGADAGYHDLAPWFAGVTPLCNTRAFVEMSWDADFLGPSTVSSGWIDLNLTGGGSCGPGRRGTCGTETAPCYLEWTPSADQWDSLQGDAPLTKIYYRVTTTDADGGNLRLSTMPMNGHWTVSPPYALLTVDGRSDY
jgi:hypothetical protein